MPYAASAHALLNVVGYLMLIVAPLLTLRVLAEEQRSGTLEALVTTPVSDGEEILSKWLGAYAFYAFMLAVTSAYMAMLAYFGDPDWGPIVAHYLGLLLLGGMFLAVGVFGSSLTRSQIVAGVVTLVVILLYMLLGLIGGQMTAQTREFLVQMNPYEHFSTMGEGHVDTRDLIYFASWTAFWMFLATRVLESRKWR